MRPQAKLAAGQPRHLSKKTISSERFRQRSFASMFGGSGSVTAANLTLLDDTSTDNSFTAAVCGWQFANCM